MSISRRSALIGASAAAVTGAAVVPLAIKAGATKAALGGDPAAVQGDDAVLLARIAEFQDLYGRWRDLWAKQLAHRARIEAMPDCPEIDGTVEGNNAHFAFLDAHDASRYYDDSGRLGEQTGAIANAIFEIPAETVKGAFGKLKIAHIVVGNNHQDGDEDLDAYQDWDAPWMETVIADFERLAGGTRT